MYLMLILIAICIIGSIVWAIVERDLVPFILGIVGIFLIIIIWGGIGSCIGMALPSDEVWNTQETQIYSLKDNINSEGQFFLGTGSEKAHLYYWYVAIDEDGARTIHKLDADNVKVYEDDEEIPRIVETWTHSSNFWHRFFAFTEMQTIKIYVPKDTIISNFEVDLE